MTPHPLLSRLRKIAPLWDSSLRLSKLGALSNREGAISVPQGNGSPGWLVLTRNPLPTAYFIARVDNPTPVPLRIVWDERCFEDTILRVEKTSTHLYLADLWMLNGIPLFEKTTFESRQIMLNKLYTTMYTPCPSFETLSVKMRTDLTDIRGYEYYTNERGAYGIFVANTEQTAVEAVLDVVRTEIPDVYKILSNGDYLSVRTLALSRYLNNLGNEFSIPCSNNRDGTWTPLVDLSSSTLTNEDTWSS